MPAFLRLGSEYPLEVELDVRLNFCLGRLADLIRTLAHAEALITDLNPDRSHYSLGIGEQSTEIKFRVRNRGHRERVLRAIREQEFNYAILNER